MSGPKVVRVVTREEILAICQGHLARLDNAVERWVRAGLGRGLLTDDEIAATRRRRDQLANLIATERFMDLQKGVPDEIEFLKADLEARLEKAAAFAAQARQRARREVQAVTSLLSSLQRRDVDVPGDVRLVLENAARGEGDTAHAFALGRALLVPSTPSGSTQELAQRVKGDEANRSVDEWIKTQPTELEDPRFAQIDLHIEQLAALSGREETFSFEERLKALGQSTDARQGLLVDSLTLDLGRALLDARAAADLAAKFDESISELAEMDPARAGQFVERRSSMTALDLIGLLKEVGVAIEQTREQRAAISRRDAVLKGLAELGYELGETMDAAWVRDGRLVLRKAAQADYGVELIGGVNAAKLQMRVVGFGATSDPARDRDAETVWCSDVGQLEAKLAKSGGGLTIERALPIGATPVKRIVSDGEQAPAAAAAPLKFRTD